MNEPVVIKEYDGGAKLHALLARKDERWLLAITRVVNGEPTTKVYGLDGTQINRDAVHLGMTPAKIAEYEADGMMKARGWDG